VGRAATRWAGENIVLWLLILSVSSRMSQKTFPHNACTGALCSHSPTCFGGISSSGSLHLKRLMESRLVNRGPLRPPPSLPPSLPTYPPLFPRKIATDISSKLVGLSSSIRRKAAAAGGVGVGVGVSRNDGRCLVR